MSLKLTDIKFEVPLPKMPAAVELFELKAPSMEERRPAIELFRKRFEMGETRTAELPGMTVMASRMGEIQFFPASGALLARDATQEEAFPNEERKWQGVERVKEEGRTVYRLNADAAKKLVAQARGVIEEARFISREMTEPVVELDQWAQMDEKGNVLSSGAGQAMVRCGYQIGGLPVAGAGAKTLLYANPGDGEARITGAFHVWRTPGAARKMEMPGVEEALAAGLLPDRELSVFQKQGRTIRITALRLCYLALPAFAAQGTLFPAFQVEGVATPPLTRALKQPPEIVFAKFVQAAAQKNYSKAGVFAHYLNQPKAELSAAAAQ